MVMLFCFELERLGLRIYSTQNVLATRARAFKQRPKAVVLHMFGGNIM